MADKSRFASAEVSADIAELGGVVKIYQVSLTGTVGTTRTVVTGHLDLPKGKYIIGAQISDGDSAKIKRIEIGSSSTASTSAIVVGNTTSNTNNVTKCANFTNAISLYVYAIASASLTISEDGRFSYLWAIKVA